MVGRPVSKNGMTYFAGSFWWVSGRVSLGKCLLNLRKNAEVHLWFVRPAAKHKQIPRPRSHFAHIELRICDNMRVYKYMHIYIYMKSLPTHVTGNLNLEITQLIILFPKKCKTNTWNIRSYLLICSFQIPRLCFPAVTKSFNSSFFMEGPCEITWHTWHILPLPTANRLQGQWIFFGSGQGCYHL